MTTIDATVQKGRIVTREPVEWPDGAEVCVTLREPEEDIFGDSPESIARWFAVWDAIPTPSMSEEEWSAWRERRRQDREWEFAHAEARAQALEAARK